MVECSCKLSLAIVAKVLTVCVAIVITALSVLLIISLGLVSVPIFIMAIYYMYIQNEAESLWSC
jgi:hypothetical protein